MNENSIGIEKWKNSCYIIRLAYDTRRGLSMYVFQLDISFQKSYCGAASFSFHFEKGKIKNWNKQLLIEKSYDFIKKKKNTKIEKRVFKKISSQEWKDTFTNYRKRCVYNIKRTHFQSRYLYTNPF